jgi:prevent-host-death family protein
MYTYRWDQPGDDTMLTLPVGEFKSRFSEVLKQVEKGDEIIISYGKGRRNMAALIPYRTFTQRKKKMREIGILKNKASFRIVQPFEMDDEEFLRS